ncbi:MAG: AsmA family protein [Rhodospirillaceae bacterium]|nr:AsmA family protein [Rhodospirillaceae bacterium]
MKKFLSLLGGLVLLVVAAVLIGPNFVDWNAYKGQLSQRVMEMTGRELLINGNVRIEVLPAPALVAEDISFSNPDGAASRHMATIKSVEVKVALGPLLGGQVKVETIRVIDPVVHLERLPDGSSNWDFKPVERKPATATEPSSNTASKEDSPASLPAIALEDIQIKNATLVYRDPITGTSERFEKFNAKIGAASLKGPLNTTGSVVIKSVPLNFTVGVGEIIHGRTVRLTVQLNSPVGGFDSVLGGTLVNLETEPKFKGTVQVGGTDLAAILIKLGGAAQSQILARNFDVAGELNATAKIIDVQELSVAFGSVRGKGDIRVEMPEKTIVGGNLAITKIDANELLAPPAKSTEPMKMAPTGAAQSDTKSLKIPDNTAGGAAPLKFNIPKDIEGSYTVNVDGIDYNNGLIRDLFINVGAKAGIVDITQVSAQFPGGSDITLDGEFQTPDGVPTFNGKIDSTVSDLRGVLKWLDVKLPGVPADRLRKLGIKAAISSTPKLLAFKDIKVNFDSSKLTGGVNIGSFDRPSFGAALYLDRIDLDAYLPRPKGNGKPVPAAKKKASDTNKKGTVKVKAEPDNAANPLAALSALSTFDADLIVEVTNLVYGGNPIKDLKLDATLYGSNLDIENFSIAKAVGASLTIKGKLNDLDAIPSAKELSIDATITDLNRLAKLAKTTLPKELTKLGTVKIDNRLNGNLLRPSVNMTTKVAGAVIGVRGRASVLPISDLLDARVTVSHKNAAKLLKRFQIGYRPAGKIGLLNFSTDAKISPSRVDLSNVKATVGKVTVRGKGNVALGGAKPIITANLKSNAIDIKPFLPAERRAGLERALQTILPAAWRPVTQSPAAPGSPLRQHAAAKISRWPKDKIDLSVLNEFDADITFEAPAIIYERYLFEKPDVAATLKNGTLKTSRLSTQTFGGSLGGSAEVTAGGRHQVKTHLKAENIDISQSLTAITGEAMANGRMNLDFDVNTTGQSVFDFVGGLGGVGSVNLSDVDVRKAGKGTMMAGLLGLLTSLNRLGGAKADDRAAMSANFDIKNGVAETSNLKLTSAYGNGTAAGNINLPNWTIDMGGKVELAQSTLTKILRAKVRESRQAVPFAIKGPLDAPNVKVDTGALLGAGIPIPGADALLNKAPKGVSRILKGILGGVTGQESQDQPPSPPPASGSPPAPADTPPPPPPSEPQQQIKPQDLLKKLFKL